MPASCCGWDDVEEALHRFALVFQRSPVPESANFSTAESENSLVRIIIEDVILARAVFGQ